MLLRHTERQLVVAQHVVRVEAGEVDELGAEVVDDGAEAEAAAPAGGHVKDGHAGVALGDLAAPGLQGLGALHRHPARAVGEEQPWSASLLTCHRSHQTQPAPVVPPDDHPATGGATLSTVLGCTHICRD